MFPVEAFENTIGKFVAIAEAIGLPFHITGGSISSAYGEPRLTQDIDIVVSPDVARIRTDDLINQLACSDFLFTEERKNKDMHCVLDVLLSEVSLAEPLGRRVGTKQQTMGSRIEPALFSATLRLRESIGGYSCCS
jgi:hypothetical protein